MMQQECVPEDFKASRRFGAWCSGIGFIAVASVPTQWLFNSNPSLRQQLILSALGFALACVAALALYRRRSSGGQTLREVSGADSAAGTQGARISQPGLESPLILPSRRAQQRRTFFWGIGICTALIGLVALTAGAPQRSELVQRIHSAGAEFASVTAEKVTDVRRVSSSGKDPYIAKAVVKLPGASNGESALATVEAQTYDDPLRPGDRVRVLYAPTQPRLGAVAGDERSLGPELRGETMPTWLCWSLIALWAIGCCVVVEDVSRSHGFRAFSHLRETDKAIRGRYTRIGQYHHEGAGGDGESAKGKYLEIQTEAGWVHFLGSVVDQVLPEMQGQQAWLLWDARRGARGGRLSPRRTPAVLVFDGGWVIHGMLNVNKAAALSDAGGAGAGFGPPSGLERPLRLWDPRAMWLLRIEPMMLGLCVLAIACAALLTFDIDNGWRWAAGITGVLSVVGATATNTSEVSESSGTSVNRS